MENIIYIVCVIAIIITLIVLILEAKRGYGVVGGKINGISEKNQDESIIKVEMLPANDIFVDDKLVEITDSKLLARINNLVPGLLQVGNATRNLFNRSKNNGEVLYRAIIPSGEKLTNSRAMDSAVRGIYHGKDGIKGHANLLAVEKQKGNVDVTNSINAAMGVASIVVGQYYMTQINAELGVISEEVSEISDFQENEYCSRVLSLIAHVKNIADFQIDILENNELRLSKIAQLNILEGECTQLLGQANLALSKDIEDMNLNYDSYEKKLQSIQKWHIYQKMLLEVLNKISEMIYTLHFGRVSRKQCMGIRTAYTQQVVDINQKLISWHMHVRDSLNIDIKKARRERKGIAGKVVNVFSILKEDLKYKTIDPNIVNMIELQCADYDDMNNYDTSDLYARDVQLISKAGKIYYLPK